MLITKEIEIDMAHFVPNHKSKCSNLHGHRYKIEVGVDDGVIQTKGVSDEGMVIDFSDLKDVMMKVIDEPFDHNAVFQNEMWSSAIRDLESFQKNRQQQKRIHFVDFPPTAENLAKHWYELVKPELAKRGIKIAHLRVWETPSSTATYKE